MPTWRHSAVEEPPHPLLISGWIVASPSFLPLMFHNKYLSLWASTVINCFWKHTLVTVSLEAMQCQEHNRLRIQASSQIIVLYFSFHWLIKVSIICKEEKELQFNFWNGNNFDVTLDQSLLSWLSKKHWEEWAMWPLKVTWWVKVNILKGRIWF